MNTSTQNVMPVTSGSQADLHDKVRNLLENTTDMIYFKDLDSVFTLCSDSLIRRLAGGVDESLIGKSDFDFYDPECAQRFYENEQEIIRTGKPTIGRVETEVRDGVNSWVFTSKLPLRDVDGHIIGTFGISRDITEQKRTEIELKKTNEQLVEASRRAGMAEIATNVIHNVGNVLTSLKVGISQSEELCSRFALDKLERVADLVDENGNDPAFFGDGQRGSHIPDYIRRLASSLAADRDKIKQELENTRRHLDHISNIVAQQQSHATSSKVIERVDLSALLSDAIQMSSSSLSSHNIEVTRHYSEGLVAETDKHQVLQIVVNLIRNAKHACLESDNLPREIGLSVSSNAETNQFSISVADNGIGIREEDFAKLFTFGFTTRDHGKGFGLHSSANTAQELGGSLEVQSEGPGKGATFVLTLPGKLN